MSGKRKPPRKGAPAQNGGNRANIAWRHFAGAAYLLLLAAVLPKWAAAFAAASVLLFALYGWDKRAAQAQRSRVPEKTLHLLALLGGWPGALLARPFFRHKTVKQPFTAIFYLCIAANIAAVCYLATGGSADEMAGWLHRFGRF